MAVPQGRGTGGGQAPVPHGPPSSLPWEHGAAPKHGGQSFASVQSVPGFNKTQSSTSVHGGDGQC